MAHDKTYADPSSVKAEHGKVIVDGPDGVAVTITPEAAVETSHRLLEKGLKANGQRLDAKDPAPGRSR
jgi:hypothetical protein